MSVPSNWFINRTTSNLFTFKLPKATNSILKFEIDKFESIREILNNIASNTPVSKEKIIFSYGILIESLNFFQMPSLASSLLEKEHLIRIKLAILMLHTKVVGLPHKDRITDLFTNTISELQELTNKTQEMWWYYACVLRYVAYRKKEFNLNLVNKTILCIANIHSKNHKESLEYFILQEYYLNFSEYPNYDPLGTLKQHFPNHPYEYDGHCAQVRHQFVLRSVKNKDYFEIQNSPLLKKELPSVMQALEVEISKKDSIFSEKITIKTTVDQYALFKFTAHICSPSPPKFKLFSPELVKYDVVDEFSVVLRKAHRTAGFCNGEGFLDIDQVKKNFSQFRSIISEELVEFLKSKKIYQFSDEREVNEDHKQFEEKFTLDQCLPQLEKLEDVRKSLAGFDGLEALFLFDKSLLLHQYGLESTLLFSVKNVVRECLEIFYQAKEANKLSHRDKHERWLSLAKNIVDSIIKKPRNLLIQIGTPIKEDKIYSDHAIYVAIKFLEKEKKFQIIITNGGTEVERFHELSPTQHPRDREEYRYVAFEPFDISTYKEALANYLYLLISLEYRASIGEDEDNEKNPDSYLNLLRNVYLREKINKPGIPQSFRGFQYKEFHTFKRQDLDETFLSQFTGNCTIHNLKKSLQILFDMNHLTFGLLEDTLILGLDELISDHLSLKATPSTLANINSQKQTVIQAKGQDNIPAYKEKATFSSSSFKTPSEVFLPNPFLSEEAPTLFSKEGKALLRRNKSFEQTSNHSLELKFRARANSLP